MNKRALVIGIVVIAVVGGIFTGFKMLRTQPNAKNAVTTTTKVQFVSSTFTVNGSVVAQSQAKLNFQTSGKLVYLPFREGDSVLAGQTIAQLDTYQLQRALASALNTYRSTRDSFDQYKDNAADNIAKSQLTYPYNNYSNAGVVGDTFNVAVTNAIQRIADQNQASLDNSVINVELANYALQLARLTSPINGVITHEDVTVPGINITSTTSFTVADPDTMVFRANIPTSSIYYVHEGSMVSLAIDGIQNKISGTIVKIYPSKVTLPTGEAVYQADIASDDLKKLGKLDESGTAIIPTNAENVALIPAWTVLGSKYVWVDVHGNPQLRQVKIGKIHGSEIEITGGLMPDDKVITNPEYIPSRLYQIL